MILYDVQDITGHVFTGHKPATAFRADKAARLDAPNAESLTLAERVEGKTLMTPHLACGPNNAAKTPERGALQ